MRRIGNTRKPSIVSTLGVSAITDPSELLEPLEEPTSSKPTKAGGGKKNRNKAADSTITGQQKKDKQSSNTQNNAGKAAQGGPYVQMSHEWIRENIKRSVPDLIADEIRIKRDKAYSRHLFYSPLYHLSGSPKAHAEAKLSNAVESTHATHDAFHYGEAEVKAAVNKRKAALRAKYGNLTNLKAEI